MIGKIKVEGTAFLADEPSLPTSFTRSLLTVRKARHSLKHNLGRAVEQRPIRHVGVARDPTTVGGAEEYVTFFRSQVEHVPESSRRLNHVAARSMKDAWKNVGGKEEGGFDVCEYASDTLRAYRVSA